MTVKIEHILLAAAGAALVIGVSRTRSAAATVAGPEQAGGNPAPAAKPSDSVLLEAALDPAKAPVAGGWRMNWHEWNWYRGEAAAKAGLCSPPCSEYMPVLGARFGLSDSQGLTASEYHGYLSQLGMSGLTWRYRKSYRRPWL